MKDWKEELNQRFFKDFPTGSRYVFVDDDGSWTWEDFIEQ